MAREHIRAGRSRGGAARSDGRSAATSDHGAWARRPGFLAARKPCQTGAVGSIRARLSLLVGGVTLLTVLAACRILLPSTPPTGRWDGLIAAQSRLDLLAEALRPADRLCGSPLSTAPMPARRASPGWRRCATGPRRPSRPSMRRSAATMTGPATGPRDARGPAHLKAAFEALDKAVSARSGRDRRGGAVRRDQGQPQRFRAVRGADAFVAGRGGAARRHERARRAGADLPQAGDRRLVAAGARVGIAAACCTAPSRGRAGADRAIRNASRAIGRGEFGASLATGSRRARPRWSPASTAWRPACRGANAASPPTAPPWRRRSRPARAT